MGREHGGMPSLNTYHQCDRNPSSVGNTMGTTVSAREAIGPRRKGTAMRRTLGVCISALFVFTGLLSNSAAGADGALPSARASASASTTPSSPFPTGFTVTGTFAGDDYLPAIPGYPSAPALGPDPWNVTFTAQGAIDSTVPCDSTSGCTYKTTSISGTMSRNVFFYMDSGPDVFQNDCGTATGFQGSPFAFAPFLTVSPLTNPSSVNVGFATGVVPLHLPNPCLEATGDATIGGMLKIQWKPGDAQTAVPPLTGASLGGLPHD